MIFNTQLFDISMFLLRFPNNFLALNLWWFFHDIWRHVGSMFHPFSNPWASFVRKWYPWGLLTETVRPPGLHVRPFFYHFLIISWYFSSLRFCIVFLLILRCILVSFLMTSWMHFASISRNCWLCENIVFLWNNQWYSTFNCSIFPCFLLRFSNNFLASNLWWFFHDIWRHVGSTFHPFSTPWASFVRKWCPWGLLTEAVLPIVRLLGPPRASRSTLFLSLSHIFLILFVASFLLCFWNGFMMHFGIIFDDLFNVFSNISRNRWFCENNVFP